VNYIYTLEQLQTELVIQDLDPNDVGWVIAHESTGSVWLIPSTALTTFLRTQVTWPPQYQDWQQFQINPKLLDPAKLQGLANALQEAILKTPMPPELISNLEDVLSGDDFSPLTLQPYLWHQGYPATLEHYGWVLHCLQQSLSQSLQYRLPTNLGHTPADSLSRPAQIAAQVKDLWASLFQAKNLLVYAQQGLKLSDLRLTIVISTQPLELSPVAQQPSSQPKSSTTLQPPEQPPVQPLVQRQINALAAAAGQALAPALVMPVPGQDLADLPSGRIVVAHSLQAEWLPLLQRSVGVICKISGLTSHAAIMARELGLPAVVGVGEGFEQFQTDQWLWLNGDQGIVAILANQPQLVAVTTAHPQPGQPSPPAHQTSRSPKPHAVKTQVMLSCSQPQMIGNVQDLPVAGVGLLRSELMLMQSLQGKHPYLWLQEHRQQELLTTLQTGIATFVAAFQPRPVFYRSLDLRSHECAALMGGEQWEPMEVNPMLGLRGVSRYRSCPELFELELAALAAVLQQHGGPLNLILPFVRSLEEVQFCHQLIAKAGLLVHPQFQLWMMAEVPAVLFSLPAFVNAGVQGITIGSNDLTQLLLGIDRESSQVEQVWANQTPRPIYDCRHPAVKAAIAQLVQAAKELAIGCCLCGELPLADPDWLSWMLDQDIPAISAAPEVVPKLQQALQQGLLQG
jgi:pyruvate, water dikinase